jgi:hypothetical protein
MTLKGVKDGSRREGSGGGSALCYVRLADGLARCHSCSLKDEIARSMGAGAEGGVDPVLELRTQRCDYSHNMGAVLS